MSNTWLAFGISMLKSERWATCGALIALKLIAWGMKAPTPMFHRVAVCIM